MTGGPHSHDQVVANASTTCPQCQVPTEVSLVDYIGLFQRDKLQAGQHGYNVSTYCQGCRIRRVQQVLLP